MAPKSDNTEGNHTLAKLLVLLISISDLLSDNRSLLVSENLAAIVLRFVNEVNSDFSSHFIFVFEFILDFRY